VRAVLDVLDELRERFNIDPDRTYLSGFSGGGQIACAVALALPEYFGGVVCIGHAPPPPQLPWHVDRARQRLSMAILNGENDSTTPLVEDLYGPWWQGVGIRTAPITVNGIGHTMPEARLIEQAYQWLEEGLADRRAKAAARPALRIADAPTRGEWADRQLADAQRLLDTADPANIEVALQQLQGLVARWDDVPAAVTAQQLIADCTARKERPWEAVRNAENMRLLELGAAGYDDLAFDGRRSVRSSRSKHAKTAIQLWEQLRNGAVGDEELRAHAAERIAALEKNVAEAPPTSNLVSLTRVRFNLDGDVTLLQGIEHMRNALAPIGYQLRYDEQALRAAGVDLDSPRKPRIKAGTFKEIDERFFRRAGVRMRRKEGIVEIVPWKRDRLATQQQTTAEEADANPHGP
jgi:pimeloyl-ACP methyl ester carboxylesterase